MLQTNFLAAGSQWSVVLGEIIPECRIRDLYFPGQDGWEASV